jgi:Late exocytosis, associated with Golgi transport
MADALSLQLPDTYVLKHNSLDGYFLLRYLRISVIICFLGCCITWPILFPVNATGGNHSQQLNLIAFGNVAKNKQNRYYGKAFQIRCHSLWLTLFSTHIRGLDFHRFDIFHGH